MPQNIHLRTVTVDSERLRETGPSIHDPQRLHERAEALTHVLKWLPNIASSDTFSERVSALKHALKPVFSALERPVPPRPVGDDFRWLYDNGRLLYTELLNVTGVLKHRRKMPHVRNARGVVMPRVLAIAEEFLKVVGNGFIEQDFCLFVEILQKTTVLELRELWTLPEALKLVLLEQVSARSKPVLLKPQDNSQGLGICVRSLREIGQVSWKDVLEPLIVMDQVLREDPAGAYATMDFESRDLYRNKISNIAEHSDCTELEVV